MCQELDIDFVNHEKPTLKSYLGSSKAAAIYRKNPSIGNSALVKNILLEESSNDKTSPQQSFKKRNQIDVQDVIYNSKIQIRPDEFNKPVLEYQKSQKS